MDVDFHVVEAGYGFEHKPVNEYHVKLRHEDYDGWFDWYHTTGTIIANRNGGTSNIGKTRNAEETAIIISNHMKNLCPK